MRLHACYIVGYPRFVIESHQTYANLSNILLGCFTSFLIKKASDFSGREENFFPFVQNLDNSKGKGVDKLYTGQHSVGRQKIENKLPY